MGQIVAIDDILDPRIALFRDVRDADLRGAHGLYLVESAVCLERWLDGISRRRDERSFPPHLVPEALLLTPEVFERLSPAIERAQAGPIFVAPMALIEQISGFDHHHGALALGRREPDADLDALLRVLTPPGRADGAIDLVITDGVVHVDNMGSLFRNAWALGASGVLVSTRCADPLLRKTVRIGMGRVFTVPWAVSSDLPRDLRTLRSRGIRVIVAEDHPDAIDVSELDFGTRCAVVFGAEGRGVSPALMAEADAVCRIPVRSGVSLNVAVASAIVLHELRCAERKRSAAGGA